ncbi:protein translocase subunit SecF [Cellulomonas marina]|uniref:Protein-export membrane protein SecF n=1 Tax=Cellulomonas marina TaxID=988821 RepID=A0A1I0W825_9CELL|nr:protein translocase subunit SecF [Cellulomonas marina]GIG29157.1 protein-export membrane protein SecF [Cellulomonas marina]SFA84173.1 preprotein translocase subunit SecF [Cellulomonas marina]
MAIDLARWGNDLYAGRRSYDIVGRRRYFFGASLLLSVVSAVLLVAPGLNPGIEFRGGSEFVVTGPASLEQQTAIDAVQGISPEESPRVTTIGGDSLRVQTARLSDTEVAEVRDALAEAYDVTADDVTSSFIGPTWGQDVSQRAIIGIVVFLALVSLVMTAYFRNWRMAVAALVALFHDLLITVGIYAAVGWEVTPATVIGFLTILGYSIYDTVVVFDKVRENTADTLDQSRYTYGEKANLAVNQTLVRSINTSVVALLPVAAILFVGAFILGAGTLRDIALALFVGMLVGTYSSIFLATPLEVALREREPQQQRQRERVLAARAAASGARPEGATVPTTSADPSASATDGSDALPVGRSARPVAPTVGALRPGQHRGTTAQPRRKGRR